MALIERYHIIPTSKLNGKDYFLSLIEEGRICSLISDVQIEQLQFELLGLLTKITELYTKGESTSIPVEKAQDILASILFVLGLALKTYPTPDHALKALKVNSLQMIFEKGLSIIRRKLAIAHHLQKRILDNLLNTPNVYYRSTIEDGINGFFKLYRPKFAAHEIHITADYPTYLERPALNGIEFIEQYLRYLNAENDFCTCFLPDDIHQLLSGLTPDYPSIPMNLFEPVILSSLGLIMTGHSPKKLNLSQRDIDDLYRKFQGKSKIDIQQQLKMAFSILEGVLHVPKHSKNYAIMCLPKLSETIYQTVLMGTLDKVFLVPTNPEQTSIITFSYDEQMGDREYSLLVAKIIEASTSEEKVKLIMQQIASLADLLDVINDAELCELDFQLLVKSLPLSSFAILLKEFSNDYFFSREGEEYLYAALQKRKATLNATQIMQLEKVLSMLS